jgi:hypothetical protein
LAETRVSSPSSLDQRPALGLADLGALIRRAADLEHPGKGGEVALRMSALGRFLL